MKKLNAYFLMLMMGLSLFTACKDDEGETPAFDEPEIEVIDSQLQQQPGESVNIRIGVVADAGNGWLKRHTGCV